MSGHSYLVVTPLVRGQHMWELPGNYPVFTVVTVIYHYIERIRRILVTPYFCITYTVMKNNIQGNQLIYMYND